MTREADRVSHESVLIIRSTQVSEMREGQREDFASLLAVRIRRLMPEIVSTLDVEEIDRAVAARVQQAIAAGFHDRADVTRYVEVSYALGWGDAGPGDELARRLADPQVRLGDWLDEVERQTEFSMSNTAVKKGT